MDSPGDVATRLATTPSKANGEAATGAAAVSTPIPGSAGAPVVEMVDISSPDPASFSFARQKKHPPALSTKPKSARKVASLFSGGGAADSGGASADKGLGDSTSKLISAAPAAPAAAPGGSICSSWQDDPGDDNTRSPGRDEAPTWDSQSGGGSGSGSGDSTGAGFTSPARKWRPGTASSRFTPQRNLVGLFASPLPLPPPTRPLLSPPNNREDGGATSTHPAPATAAADPTDLPDTNLMGAAPLLLLSPKPEEIGADEAPSNRPEAKATPARAAAAEEAAAAMAPAAVELPKLPAAGAGAAVPPAPTAATAAAASAATSAAVEDPKPKCRCGCSSSRATGTDFDDVCCVSNEAFKDGKTMRTLEVLVKRERVGVSALASWRVAELKRRLVHMKLFPAAEVITLVPTFPLGGGAALEDDVTLDTLDIDVTYKARRTAVAAAT